ncbi:aminoglycoside 6-adenylyltransferase [Bacillus sp. FJAT-49732]|uniref:Aminoglycoside 6-adenylyltransferase n=1 Tax=Lederbergia citrisecunda TaxID=2833583 RepID=A0A942YQ33_9BACI|nr:aminoglycoside 6-adenylyltransferase [Lederbergia citrisecunda]MBS4201876.1 aminoglycoside 6-adenylyltransferase [Lederbergia citrisecunda]
MYQSEDRTTLLNKIIDFSRTIHDIQGLLLVGSGANGFRDEFSDLDLLIVVKNSKDVVQIHDQLQEYINHHFHVLKEKVYRHEEDIFVTCFFFENYLELDLGVWSKEKLRATKPYWKVMFDRENNEIQRILEESLTSHGFSNIDEAIQDSLSFIWQFYRSAAVALKRKQYMKAMKDMDFIRDQIIRFLCIQNGINYDFDKSIDQLDSPFLSKLKRTYEVKMNDESIQKVLFELIDLYFDVIGTMGDEDGKIIRSYLYEMLEV